MSSEMGDGKTTVDGFLLVGVSSNLRENIFSLEELVIGLPSDMESVIKENKQLNLSGKGVEPSL